ncbi:MAG: HDOD domain-containing protein [Gammaproteobacteria bacterium]|nr:HDOD domain-containing protein [Gammaproteobacteria bacterium]
MPELLVTRLPVYAPDLKVSAYFLRSDYQESAPDQPFDVANAHVLIAALTRPDLTEVDAQPYYIALSKSLLDQDYLSLLPKERFSIVLPFQELDGACIDQMTALSQKGYQFAISDFELNADSRRALFVVSGLFVGAMASDAEIRKILTEAKRFDIPVIATGIDDHALLKRMRELKVGGYMGDFLTKPDLFTPISEASNRLIVYKLLEALQDPNVSFDVLEALLVKDNRLSYKLLKVLNSPQYASAGRKVTSLRDMFMLMGLDSLKSWATLIALTNIEDKPYELMVATMLRAKMAQRMAEVLGIETPEAAFMTGLLSTLDALLDKEIVDVLDELPIGAAVKDALLQHAGPLGSILRDVINYERGNWEALNGSLLARDDYRRLYTESVIWASKLCATLTT